MIRVVIAERLHLFRSGLVALLAGEPGLAVAEAADSGAALVAACRHHRPDVALVGAELPDMPGLDAVRAVLRTERRCAVVVVADRPRPGELRAAVDGGALGFVLRDSSPTDLVEVIHRVARGEHAVDGRLALAELAAARNPLTPRERDVLAAVAEGATVGEIAGQLCLSTGTVRNYVARVQAKLGARTRVEAVSIAREHGWLPYGARDGSGRYPLNR
ncbi:LuxR C-terminal-related transcriptional regulator [Actinomadura kijaniata]|uniref:LuxR C-terminal-related transcriptional regulator n=1 Tax=Actinomadura kijaniata TaxID=46161 RepID=UPI003F1BB9DD